MTKTHRPTPRSSGTVGERKGKSFVERWTKAIRGLPMTPTTKPAPFVIDGPGEYVLRDATPVRIYPYENGSGDGFCWCDRPDNRGNLWNSEGGRWARRYPDPTDIVAKAPRPVAARKRRYVVYRYAAGFSVFDKSRKRSRHVADGLSRALARKVAAWLNEEST